MIAPSNSEIKYSYRHKKFKRIVSRLKIKGNLLDLKKIIGAYKMEYHFTKKIKSTTTRNATISKNKKILSVEELLKNPKVHDFEVRF